jgi:hypothetical protein
MIILCVQNGDCWFICFTSLALYLLPTYGCKVDERWSHVRIRLTDYVACMTDNVTAYKIYLGKRQRKQQLQRINRT